MPDQNHEYDAGSELLPDWSDIDIDDSPEAEGDPHEGGDV